MSQRELERRSGVPQALICRVEKGKDALLSTYERLLEAMGATLIAATRQHRDPDEIFAELRAERAAARERESARRYARVMARRLARWETAQRFLPERPRDGSAR